LRKENIMGQLGKKSEILNPGSEGGHPPEEHNRVKMQTGRTIPEKKSILASTGSEKPKVPI